MRTLWTLCLLVFAAGFAAAAVDHFDSPAARQAQGLLSGSGAAVFDGNTRPLSRLQVRSGERSIDEELDEPPAPGPRVGPGPAGLDEPSNPVPKPDSEKTGSGGFLSGMNWKTVGFAAGGLLLGVGLGLLLGWGWLGIAALAVAGAAAGWFAPKLF